MTLPHLFLNGIRVPFHATRFVRGDNETLRLSSARDRRGEHLPLVTPPVGFSPFHSTTDSNGAA